MIKFILRVLGTWFLVLAVILLVIDGTRTFGASALIMTPLGETWSQLNAESLVATMTAIEGAWAPLATPTGFILSLPGWAVSAVLGIVFAGLGRRKSAKRYVDIR